MVIDEKTTELLARLASVATMPELDAMRLEIVQAMKADGTRETFDVLQPAFRRAKNRLQRVPLRERTW